MGPRLMRRFDPGTASTVSFLLQLLTLLVIVVFALRIVDLNPRAIALGGAVTAVVIGLAAQSTLGNVIAGIMLQASRPFRVGERVRLQGGTARRDGRGHGREPGSDLHRLRARQRHVPGAEQLRAERDDRAAAQPRGSGRAGAAARGRAAERARAAPHATRSACRRATIPTSRSRRSTRTPSWCASSATPVSDADGPRLADEVLGWCARSRPSRRRRARSRSVAPSRERRRVLLRPGRDLLRAADHRVVVGHEHRDPGAAGQRLTSLRRPGFRASGSAPQP